MVNSTLQAITAIGLTESQIILSQCATYGSPKSNAAYQAIYKANQSVKETGSLSVPLDLRNAPTKLMKSLGYGDNYKYAHEFDQNFVDQEFLPNGLENSVFYEPGDNSREQIQRDFLKRRWKDKYNY